MRTLVLVSTGQAFAIERALRIGSADFCEVKVSECAPEHFRIDAVHIEAIAACAVGKVAMSAGQRRRIVVGCPIEAGGMIFDIRDESDESVPSGIPTREAAFLWLKRHEANLGVGVPTLEIVEGPHEGLRLPLTSDGPYRLGRDSTCHMALVRDMEASREHLEISVENGIVFVRDLDTTRGTWMGAERLAPRRRAVWEAGTMLRIGTSTVLALHVPPWTKETIAEYAQGLRSDAMAAPISPAQEVTPEVPASLPSPRDANGGAAIAPPLVAPAPKASLSAIDIAVYSALFCVGLLSLAGLIWILWDVD